MVFEIDIRDEGILIPQRTVDIYAGFQEFGQGSRRRGLTEIGKTVIAHNVNSRGLLRVRSPEKLPHAFADCQILIILLKRTGEDSLDIMLFGC